MWFFIIRWWCWLGDWKFRSLGWGFSHMGSPSPLSTSIRSTRKSSMLYFTTSIHLFLCLPLLHCPRMSASTDTILLFSALYMPKPSHPGLPYFVCDARYSKDATDIVIPLSSFLFLSLNVRPTIHLSIFMSVFSKCSSSRLFNVHVSEP